MAKHKIGSILSGGTDQSAAIAALTSRLTSDETSLEESPDIEALTARLTADETSLDESAEVDALDTRMDDAEDAIAHKAAAVDLDNVFAIATGAASAATSLDARVDVLEGQPKIGVLLIGDPDPTTPGFWFRETS